MKKTTSGFTIVELLIVIVVIAILAAISIVAYNGIQTRAHNAQTISATQQAIKLLKLYKVDNGVYPSGYNYACIGDYTDDTCQYLNSLPEVAEQASFKTAIATVGSMPQPYDKLYDRPSSTRTGGGAWYRVGAQDVTYILNGDVDCGAGGTKSVSDGLTQCRYSLD